jgi:hypothetical protein
MSPTVAAFSALPVPSREAATRVRAAHHLPMGPAPPQPEPEPGVHVIHPGRFCGSPADATTDEVCGRPLQVVGVSAEDHPLLLVCPLHRDHGFFLAQPERHLPEENPRAGPICDWAPRQRGSDMRGGIPAGRIDEWAREGRRHSVGHTLRASWPCPCRYPPRATPSPPTWSTGPEDDYHPHRGQVR